MTQTISRMYSFYIILLSTSASLFAFMANEGAWLSALIGYAILLVTVLLIPPSHVEHLEERNEPEADEENINPERNNIENIEVDGWE